MGLDNIFMKITTMFKAAYTTIFTCIYKAAFTKNFIHQTNFINAIIGLPVVPPPEVVAL